MKIRYCIHKPMLSMGNGYCREIRLLNIPQLPDTEFSKPETHMLITDELKGMWPGWDIEAYYLVQEAN